MSRRKFSNSRETAYAVLTSGIKLTPKAISFLGKLVAEDPPRLTDPQAAWLAQLLIRAGLPRLRLRGDR